MTVRITGPDSALRYLDSVDESYERDPKNPDNVLEHFACYRCGGTGIYSNFHGVCFACGNGPNKRGTRSVPAVDFARKVKSRKTKEARNERKRQAREKAAAEAQNLAEAFGAEALAALRPHFSGDTAYIDDWDAFCAAVDAFCTANMMDAAYELNAQVRKLRREEVEAQRERARAIDAETSQYVGTVGERRTFSLKLDRAFSFQGRSFGYYDNPTTYGYIFLDDDGNVFKWFTKAAQDFEAGKTYTGKATVKSHEVYKDVRQTTLTRVKFAEVEEAEVEAAAA